MQETKPLRNAGKQRKRLFNAPAHLRHKLMAAPLARELAASKKAKSLPVRKGDTVRIQRGDHKGFEGKVTRVDLKRYRIFVEGLTREKVDGTNIFVSVHPSKVMIKNLSLDDKLRKQVVERKQPLKEKAEKKEKVVKPAEKPKKKPVGVKEEKPVAEKTVAEEKTAEKAPAATKKKVTKKPVAAKKKTEEKPVEEEKPKAAKKPRAKSKTAPKTEGGT